MAEQIKVMKCQVSYLKSYNIHIYNIYIYHIYIYIYIFIYLYIYIIYIYIIYIYIYIYIIYMYMLLYYYYYYYCSHCNYHRLFTKRRQTEEKVVQVSHFITVENCINSVSFFS